MQGLPNKAAAPAASPELRREHPRDGFLTLDALGRAYGCQAGLALGLCFLAFALSYGDFSFLWPSRAYRSKGIRTRRDEDSNQII